MNLFRKIFAKKIKVLPLYLKQAEYIKAASAVLVRMMQTTDKDEWFNCENKIKGNLRFEKGIKQITTSVPDQKVTIEYDADKTTPENIAKGFAKIGYKATVVTGEAKKKGCSGCSKKADATKGSCCKKNGEKKEGSCSEKAEVKKEGCGGCSKKAEAVKGNCSTK